MSTTVDDSTWERFLGTHAELGRPMGPLEFSDGELLAAISEAHKRWFRHTLEKYPSRPSDPGATAHHVAKVLRDPEPRHSVSEPRSYCFAVGIYPASKSDVSHVVARLLRLEREGVVSRTPSPWGSFWRSEKES